MAEFPGIQYDTQLRESMDYFFLRREGIRYAQELSGKIWTDYNEHDPGVTILEQLCYALTGIGYKTNIDIRNLMFSGENEGEVTRLNGIFAPEEIFLTGTVTHHDFKILLLNKLRKEKVEDVWFKRSKDRALNGLYDIYLRTAALPSEYSKLEQKVREVYAEHRSICEDLHRVVILKPEYIEIITAIEIRENVLPERMLAEIFYKLNNYFNPKPSNHSFHDLLEAGLGYEEIFDLPSFENGFIRGHESDDYNTVFPISGITAIIEEIPGIRKVRSLMVKKNGIKVTNQYISIEDGHVPKIVVNPGKKEVEIYRNHSIVPYDAGLVKRYYDEKSEQGNKSHSFVPSPFEKTSSDIRSQISLYTSVQNTFPVVYGIGKFGLPGGADKNRVKHARQLQSFLLFFDQLMINHLAQLENLPALFSYKVTPGDPTYFTRLPAETRNEVPDFDKVADPQLDNSKVAELVNDHSLTKKNRLLDHLLARFSETLLDHPYENLPAVLGLTEEDDLAYTLASLKSSLLDQYSALSKNRNKGYDYSADPIQEYPFKRKLLLMLNVSAENEPSSLTSQYSSLLPVENREQGQPGSTGESNRRRVRFRLPNHPEVRDHLVFYGALKDSYNVIKVREREEWYALLFNTPRGKTLLAEYASRAEAASEVQALVSKFRALNKKAEGFHVIEHILLRPLLYKQYDVELAIRLNNRVWFFRSVLSDELEEQENTLTEAIIYGTDISNYAVTENENGFIISLNDKAGNQLLRLERIFTTREEATDCIVNSIMPDFKKWDRDRPAIPSEATFKQTQELFQHEELKSPKITLLFPAWVPRFSDPDFKDLLNHSLSKCLPAHLEVQVRWLGLDKMIEFEKEYKKWIGLKSSVTQKQHSILMRRDTAEGTSIRKEKWALREDIIQLDNLSNDLLINFTSTENT